MLPNIDQENAKTMAEKVRQAVYDLNIPHDKSSISQYVTVSTGCLHDSTPVKSTGKHPV